MMLTATCNTALCYIWETLLSRTFSNFMRCYYLPNHQSHTDQTGQHFTQYLRSGTNAENDKPTQVGW
jgi:hypothetical protein